MKIKHKRLRLRKQVIYSIPIAVIIAVLSIVLISSQNKMSSTSLENNTKLEDSLEVDDVVLQKDFEYLNFIDNYLDERMLDNTVIYYAKKFSLNVDKTLELARYYTNDYKSEQFNTTFVIGPESVQLEEGPFNNAETGIAYFVRRLYSSPSKYGTTPEELGKVYDIVKPSNNIGGTIYLDNGMTFEQYMGKICDLFELDKETALAITYLESGYLSSRLFINANNIGGQRDSAGWLRFPTLEAGIIAHVITIKSLLAKYSIDISSDEGILQLSSVYVNGYYGTPVESWASKVIVLRDQIKEKNLFA